MGVSSGLGCGDVSCGLDPSDRRTKAEFARVVVHSLGDGAFVCTHSNPCMSSERMEHVTVYGVLVVNMNVNRQVSLLK